MDGQMDRFEELQWKARLALNLVAGFLLSLRIIPGNKSRFEIHPNLIKTLNTKDCAFLTAWLEEWEARGGRVYCNHFTGGSMRCCAFCCYWRQIGIPDKCENVSKLRREAGKVPEVDLVDSGIITAIVRLSVSLPTLSCVSADAGNCLFHPPWTSDYRAFSNRRYYFVKSESILQNNKTTLPRLEVSRAEPQTL